MNMPTVAFQDVLGDDLIGPPTLYAIDLLSQVEVIFGRDIPTQEVFLVYGRNRLQQMMSEGSDETEVDVLVIDVDRNTGELDHLLALVQLAKDGYDYVEAA